MSFHDTILALSSPPPAPEAPRAILRLSGPDAWPLAQQLLPGLALRAGYRPDLAVPLLHPRLPVAAALLFHAPRSFTGEDVAELHLPNSPALIAACSAAILRFGPGKVRPANPGEFSARAFFNGKIDLTEAEGIAATIHAADQRERRAAAGLRNGALHHAIDALAQQIADTLALVEAGIDFTEEEGVSFIAAGELLARLTRLADHLQTQIESSCRIDRLDTLPTVVFVGRPNVGKSSLINALAGSARSITSPIAGTTRDMLAVLMPTPVGPIRLLDVPGEEAPTDELRRKMMDARAAALLDADLAIDVVTDAARVVASVAAPVSHGPLTFRVQNKADLLSPDVRESNTGAREPWQLVSATTGYHLAELRAAIARFAARHEPAGQYTLTLNQRHRALLVQTLQTLHAAIGHAAQDSAGAHPELLASHLRHALDLLGQITGTISPDEILGRIFSTFCIGK